MKKFFLSDDKQDGVPTSSPNLYFWHGFVSFLLFVVDMAESISALHKKLRGSISTQLPSTRFWLYT